ncbi:hypothetical protein BD410DRAFT_807037 [Rickenella mellea]|uniref:Uncharacterized protein n=1 Tax=Rickenella mellea TaxID=50990 RepID=A0A4Y7PQR8_9AGAM|nr:hypothetical protein BD410DRAFT_807037 [Rickenella mellea]
MSRFRTFTILLDHPYPRDAPSPLSNQQWRTALAIPSNDFVIGSPIGSANRRRHCWKTNHHVLTPRRRHHFLSNFFLSDIRSINPMASRSIRTAHAGLSTSIKKHSFRGRSRHVHVLQAGSQEERRRIAQEDRAAAIQGMSEADREVVAQTDVDDALPSAGTVEYEAAFNTIPPGDEAYDLSHEGGEHEVFEGFAEDLSRWTGYRRVDHRDRRDRVEIRTKQWNDQMELLVDAYLMYSMHYNEDGGVDIPQTAEQPEASDCFEIEVLFCNGVLTSHEQTDRKKKMFVTLPSDIFANVTLLRNGYLGAAPLQPSVAITIRSLALYRQAHRVCPRFSIQAEVRKLCHIHRVRRHSGQTINVIDLVFMTIGVITHRPSNIYIW